MHRLDLTIHPSPPPENLALDKVLPVGGGIAQEAWRIEKALAYKPGSLMLNCNIHRWKKSPPAGGILNWHGCSGKYHF
jgi:hypothetical protein